MGREEGRGRVQRREGRGRKVNILEMQQAQFAIRALHPRQTGPADLGWGWSWVGLAGVSATHPAEACCLLGQGRGLGHKAVIPG